MKNLFEYVAVEVESRSTPQPHLEVSEQQLHSCQYVPLRSKSLETQGLTVLGPHLFVYLNLFFGFMSGKVPVVRRLCLGRHNTCGHGRRGTDVPIHVPELLYS